MKTTIQIMRNICAIACACLAPALHGQILDIKEIPQVGKKTYEMKILKVNYVDINSQFDIRLHKDSLKARIGRDILHGNDRVESLLAELNGLKDFSDRILILTETFGKSLIAFSQSKSPADRTAVERNLSDLALVEEKFLNAYTYPNPWLYRKYEAMFAEYAGMPDIFRVQTEEMKNFLTLQLDSALREQGIYIQVGAWLITKEGNISIHLDGFDEYPLGELYEWKTVNLQLDEQQLQELESMQTILEENSQNYQQIFKTIGKEYANMLLGLLGPVQDSAAVILNTVQQTMAGLSSAQAEIKTELESIKTLVSDYKNYLTGLVASYQGGNLQNYDKFRLLTKFYNDQNEIIRRTEEYFSEIRTRTKIILARVSGAANELKASLETLDRQVSSLSPALNKSFENISAAFNAMVFGAKFNSDLLVFGDKVKKLSIDHVPASTAFSLKYTGKRNPGDQVILKVGAGTPAMSAAKDLEVVYMNLLAAEPHIHMSVAYDFAWPVAHTGDMPPNGPSYSVLCKFRGRNPIYRNVFDFGLGLNFATFDFNKDNIPEIAAGLCASMLRDYIQAGWGFNFNANTGYYFVGIRIPISISNIYFSGSAKE
jgi:hypothetical protein